MTNLGAMEQLARELLSELQNHILPYWLEKTVDEKNGGFLGQIDGNDDLIYDAPKGAILNTRILWTFSASYSALKNEEYRVAADRAYHYLNEYFWDPQHGGLYWMLNADGSVLDSKKHAYAQAFGIYAFSEYYKATGNLTSLNRAIELFRMLDKHAYNSSSMAYVEAFDQKWEPLKDVRLSEIDAPEERSTNTHLHILEAYTNLQRCWKDETLTSRLHELILVFFDKIYNVEQSHYHAFFNAEWEPQTQIYSYGHDIEASWLLTDAIEVLDSKTLRARNISFLKSVAYTIVSEGWNANDGGIYNLGSHGSVLDRDRHWWAQAEAIVGFINAFQVTNDTTFLDAAVRNWDYIKARIIDHENGEWFFRVDDTGQPYTHEDKVGSWKCPYHTSRACLEINERLEKISANLIENGLLTTQPTQKSLLK